MSAISMTLKAHRNRLAAELSALDDLIALAEKAEQQAPPPVVVAAPAAVDPNELLTVKETAALLKISPKTVYTLPEDLLPRAKHPTSLVRFRRADVERYRTEHQGVDEDVIDLGKVS